MSDPPSPSFKLPTKYQIIFEGTSPQRQPRTTSVSSDQLKGTPITLQEIRKHGKLPQAYVFCITDTNTVGDTTKLVDYIPLIEKNVTAKPAAEGASTLLTVQYASKHRPPAHIPKPPSLPTPPADHDKGGVKVPDDKPPVTHNIATAGLVEKSDKVTSTHPAELTDQEWDYIMVTNSLLHGMCFDVTSHTLKKAREPAFSLKLKGSTPGQPAGTESDQLCIPAFQVNDDSSVTITEVKSTLQLSMTQHAFSSTSAKLAVSGGYGPISGGVSAGASFSGSKSTALTEGDAIDSLHASYNFPRVRIFLTADELAITPGCKELLKDIEANRRFQDVVTFYRKYGHIFAGSVQLGGRLQATKDSSTFKSSKAEDNKNSMKVAAAVSLSSPYASASASASHAQGKDAKTDETSENESASLTWEAQGGETLLASNPPAWITTVGSFYNWRVIERSDVHSILSLLRDVSKKDWPAIFRSIEGLPVLSFVSKATQADEIQIENAGNTAVYVAVANGTLTSESAMFFVLGPSASRGWKRTGKESVFISGMGPKFGRVAIAMADLGYYKIRQFDYDDPDIEYTKTAGSGVIGIMNDTGAPIEVKIHSEGSQGEFSTVPNGELVPWARNDYETIFVKHPASDVLCTYLGVPGYDLKLHKPSSLPIFHLEDTSTTDVISIFNSQSYEIDAKVSVAGSRGQPGFFPVEPQTLETWERAEPEVIYLSVGPAVRAYYGKLGFTLRYNGE